MSAGTGIVHAERNPSSTTPLHLLQIWILPRTRGLAPRWEQQRFPADARAGRLLPVIRPTGVPGDGRVNDASTLRIDQDATIYVAALTTGQTVTHAAAPGRRAYLFAIAGALDLDGLRLESGDQARITEAPTLSLTARTPAELILIDLP